MDLDVRAGELSIGGWTAPAFELGLAAALPGRAHLRFGVGYARTDLGWERSVESSENASYVGEFPLLVRTASAVVRVEWREGPGVQERPSWDAGPILGLALDHGEEQRVVVLAEDPPEYLLVEVTPYATRTALRPHIAGYAEIWTGPRFGIVVEQELALGLPLIGSESEVRFEHTLRGGVRLRLDPAAKYGDDEGPPRHYAPELLPPWRR